MSNPKKILVLTSTYPATADSNDPRFVADLSERLSADFDILLLTQHRPGTPNTESRNGVSIIRYRYAPERLELLSENGGIANALQANPWLALLLPFFVLAQINAIRKLIAEEKPALIHAHWLIPQSFCAIIARALGKHRPLIVATAHGGDVYGLRGQLAMFLKRWTLKHIDRLCVVSTAMRSFLSAQTGIDQKEIDVMPMGADLENMFVLNPHIDRIDNRLAFVGRLVEKKGLKYLIQCFAELALDRPGLTLQIAGDGPLRDSLERQTHELGISHQVQFLGSLSHSEVARLFQSSGCAVFPFVQAGSGDMEGLGLVVLEAMGCGCLVVAGDVPAVHDMIVTNKTGLLCDPTDRQSMLVTMKTAIDDSDVAHRIANAGHEFAREHYGWSASTVRYRDLFLDLLKDG